MRILVCLKQVPDTTEIKLSSNFTLQRDFVAQVMNPADESALELGLSLRDAHGGSVTVITMGPARAETMLREALSRGADEAFLLTDPAFAGADTLVTAECLKAAVEKLGGFDVILCGRRAVDGETGQVGPMLASMLDIPCVPNITEARLASRHMQALQLTEAGQITWKVPLPALFTLCEWSHRLRLPTILGLKKSRTLPVTVWKPGDLGILSCGLKASPTRVVGIHTAPTGVRPCRKLPLKDVLKALEEKGALK